MMGHISFCIVCVSIVIRLNDNIHADTFLLDLGFKFWTFSLFFMARGVQWRNCHFLWAFEQNSKIPWWSPIQNTYDPKHLLKKMAPCSTSNKHFLSLVTQVYRGYVCKYLFFTYFHHLMPILYIVHLWNVWPGRILGAAGSHPQLMSTSTKVIILIISYGHIQEVLLHRWSLYLCKVPFMCL